MKTKILFTLFSLISALTTLVAGNRYAAESVLNEGKWVKIEIEETGIHKLTYAELRKMGFDQPEQVSVYGYGGWPIDEDFSKGYLDDLPAVPVWKGEDYLLFYGRGTIRWEYDETIQTFVHTQNPYSIKGYYFLTDRDGAPRIMENEPSKGNGSGLQANVFDDYILYEQELVSLNSSGRELYGESFEGISTPKTIPFPSVPGITQDTGIVTMRFVARPTGNSATAKLYIDGNDILTVGISAASSVYTVANSGSNRQEWKAEKKENMEVKVGYSNSSHKNSRLDYIRMHIKRELRPYGAFTFFRNLQAIDNDTRFIVDGADAQTLVWDVTDPHNAKVMETTLNGTQLTFSIEGDTSLREFVIVQPNHTGFLQPVKAKDIDNQNLHALGKTDMVIIALPFAKAQAERLAEIHREKDQLTVEVIDPHAIYNEFSSGTPDASAYRRLMKMLYDRAATESDRPRYLLLFGDGIYDNRGICAKIRDTYPAETIHDRMLLTFQSPQSLNMSSFVTDDYFGFLRDDNGSVSNMDKWKMEIGVGRFPVRTEKEARQVVNKTISYMNNKEIGPWKNSLCFLADDGSSGDDFTNRHMEQANELAEMIENNHPEFRTNKVLFDAYKKDKSGSSTYPDVRKRLQQLLKNGLLVLNYSGHGDTQSLSDEKVVTQTDIAQSSYTKLPLWITATCDFCRFDALATSAGEQVFLHTNSGGIALVTTTRVVDREPNFVLNQKLIQHLFDRKDGKRLTLGEVMQRTKNELSGENKLNFILIGDPAMRLAYPDYEIEVTSVNGKPASETIDMKALEKITVEGVINNFTGNVASDFNGFIYPTVLDSKVSLQTLDNNDKGRPYTYTDYANTLFIGNDQVENGKFKFTFTVPKDISYSNDFGKMSLYAYSTDNAIEAQGVYKNYKVGGTSTHPETDNEGPEIRRMYLNDSTFVSGDKVNTTPLFVADVWDQTGVNITGNSVGHDIMLIIDGNPSLSYNLNNYYEMIPGREGEGRVIFPIPALSEGEHTAEFIVWDIHNNSSRDTIQFVVSPAIKPQLIDVYANPNPAREQVEFRLIHNRPESMMTVEIRVFDMSGRLLWKGEQQGSSELFKDFILNWDLTDSSGSRLRPGVYVYRAAVKTKSSKEATKGNKLLVLGQ